MRAHVSLLFIVLAACCFEALANDSGGWIDFQGSGGHVEFEVEVNGVPAGAILDTGADTAAVSASLAERAGIDLNQNRRVRIIGVHGQREVPTTGRFTLQFAGQPVEVGELPVVPAGGVDVVIGRSMFEWAVVQIDYPNDRIRFLRREAVDFKGNVKIKTTRRGAPMIRGRVGGEGLWMLLDTGNSGLTVMKRRFVLRHDFDDHQAGDLELVGMGAIARGDQHLLSVPRFDLGPYRFESLLATYSTGGNDGFDHRRNRHGSRMLTDRARYDAILGYEVMRNFLVTMDLAGERIHLAVP